MASQTIQQAIDLALSHHKSGQLREAETLYRQILAQDPNQPDALHFLGLLAHQVGRNDAAVDLMQRAVALNPGVPHYHSNIANVYRALGRYTEAVDACRRALALEPDSADTHNNLGMALQEQVRGEEAIACYEKSLSLNPRVAVTHNNLGVALQGVGRLEEAEAAYRQALVLQPDYADAHSNFASLRLKQERIGEAIEGCRRTLALNSRHVTAHFNMGNALRAVWRLDEAIESYRRAIAIYPRHHEAWHNLGNIYTEQGRVEEAVECCRQVAALRPDDSTAHGDLLYAMQFHPRLEPAEIEAEHQRWSQRHARPLIDKIRPHLNDRSPDRRLRIGYLSRDFRVHPVGRLLEALFVNHDHRDFETVCYFDSKYPDSLTARIKPHFDLWRDTAGLTDEQLADLIRSDKVDILMDLVLHMAGSRMMTLARKPAPMQLTYVGYPASAGLETIEYRFTDRYMDPPGCLAEGPEKLVYLPGCYWCYTPPDPSPPVNDLPALSAGHIAFGCFNNFFKVNGEVIALWSKVLHAVPRSRLHMLIAGGSHNAYVYRAFAGHGIAADRLQLIGRVSPAEFMGLHHNVDILLDPFPYNGHTTTMDAFHMGVPEITLACRRAVGRAGVTLLTHVGLSDLIAQTPEQYVELAAGLASDLPRLAELRRTLRERMRQSPLMDGPRFARGVEQAYREMWQAWAGGRTTA